MKFVSEQQIINGLMSLWIINIIPYYMIYLTNLNSHFKHTARKNYVSVFITIVQELEQEKREAEEAKRKAKQKSLLGFLQNGAGTNDDDQGSIEISLAGLFKCLLCTHGKPSAEKQQLVAIAESLEQLGKRLETIER